MSTIKTISPAAAVSQIKSKGFKAYLRFPTDIDEIQIMVSVGASPAIQIAESVNGQIELRDIYSYLK